MPAVQSLIDLYTADLAEVRFPDVDGRVLAEITEQVRAEAARVAAAELALESAKASLAAQRDALITRAQRALAYARVYAEEDPALSARLHALELPRTARRATREIVESGTAAPDAGAPSRKRGRPPRAAAPSSLFAAEASAAVA